MEEARQHPALNWIDWLLVAARLVFFACAVAILVFAFSSTEWVIRMAIVGCIAAAVMSGTILIEGLLTGSVRWKERIHRSTRANTYWMFILFFAATLVAYSAVFLFLTDII